MLFFSILPTVPSPSPLTPPPPPSLTPPSSFFPIAPRPHNILFITNSYSICIPPTPFLFFSSFLLPVPLLPILSFLLPASFYCRVYMLTWLFVHPAVHASQCKIETEWY